MSFRESEARRASTPVSLSNLKDLKNKLVDIARSLVMDI
jgi:hypothetical protein